MLPTKALYRIIDTALKDSIEHYKDDYEVRVKTQKFIYLFDQMWGENFYDHSWCLAGPYSATLTHQIYDSLLDDLSNNKEAWNKIKLSNKDEMPEYVP